VANASAGALAPAVLPDTPTSFPIAADRLIALAQAAFATRTGIEDDSVLAPDFRFEFPVVSLGRSEYLNTVKGFDLAGAFPDMNSHAYDWRVDPYEPNRVWFTIRGTSTHTGALNFGGATYPATGKQVFSPPECCSYVFNEDGKVKTFTGGVVMDRRVGNTGGWGAAFGLLYAIGALPYRPGSLRFALILRTQRAIADLKKKLGSKKE
jgi:hypothetical protein